MGPRMNDTYEILDIAGKAAIKCRICGRISYNLNDVRNRYCGHCRKWHVPALFWENWDYDFEEVEYD